MSKRESPSQFRLDAETKTMLTLLAKHDFRTPTNWLTRQIHLEYQKVRGENPGLKWPAHPLQVGDTIAQAFPQGLFPPDEDADA